MEERKVMKKYRILFVGFPDGPVCDFTRHTHELGDIYEWTLRLGPVWVRKLAEPIPPVK